MYDRVVLQLIFAGVFLFLLTGSGLMYLVFLYSKKMYSGHLEKQQLLFELEHKELNMSFQERELILEEISGDIHDNIGQIAHLVRMNLHTIKKQSYSLAQTELIDYVAELMSRLIKDVRHIGHSLDADFIKVRGLHRMLEYDMEHMNASKKITCSLDVQGNERLISAEQQLLVYRIAQQAISNTLLHAKAYCLEIYIKYFQDKFSMIIKDDGIGFDEGSFKDKSTTGLNNMRKRARLLNGALDIVSGPGAGCSITLGFPI